MVNIFSYNNFNRIFLHFALYSFTITYTFPIFTAQYHSNINVNDVVFMIRLEKLVEKLIESKEKSTEKMIGYLVDIEE